MAIKQMVLAAQGYRVTMNLIGESKAVNVNASNEAGAKLAAMQKAVSEEWSLDRLKAYFKKNPGAIRAVIRK